MTPVATAGSAKGVCDPSAMKSAQETPCGVIPDSGTTLMMGPKDQVDALLAALCEGWPRCKSGRRTPRRGESASGRRRVRSG